MEDLFSNGSPPVIRNFLTPKETKIRVILSISSKDKILSLDKTSNPDQIFLLAYNIDSENYSLSVTEIRKSFNGRCSLSNVTDFIFIASLLLILYLKHALGAYIHLRIDSE